MLRARGEAVLAKLSEVPFVETHRRYIAELPPEQTDWLAGAPCPDLIISKQQLEKVNRIELVRIKREQSNQNLCFSSRPSFAPHGTGDNALERPN